MVSNNMKPLVSLGTTDKWCDYELLSEAAALLKQDKRGVHIRLKDFGSIMIITPAGGRTSLSDLADMVLYIADCLEDINRYDEFYRSTE